jgi:hypothetical protein
MLTPEQEREYMVFHAYHEGRLDLDEAASQLQNLSLDVYRTMPQAVSPSQRALFGKIARLRGEDFPEGPDPRRHGDGGTAKIATMARDALNGVRAHPRRWMGGLVFLYYFAVEAEDTARAIIDWLLAHQQEQIEVLSPYDDDVDDWFIDAATPCLVWSRKQIDDWVAMIRDAPLVGNGSFCWWGGPV